ncbi:MAG TPA: FAD-linked oxidase C-terminal domain-containing protein, partial [Baekduia sp.]|nr:FAD-linked oxidase C-terminal domain-containing protein [Baekduia sp.]
VPIVPRGAGSGLAGAANAVDGCVVLSLERMTDVVEVDAASRLAVVQPGVTGDGLRAAVAGDGLWYAPDPASAAFSTIGGNVATNAGGLCCVKYGVTREALLGLEVVLASGEVVRLGGRTRKRSAGYDLMGLLCGSEGTLGVVTEVTARLLPAPPAGATVAASFPRLEQAGAAVSAITAALTPAVLEIMDAATIAAVEDYRPMDLDRDAEAMLFARSDAAGAAAPAEAERIAALCEAAGADLAVVSDDPAEGRMLMAGRRLAHPALEHRGATLLDDVCVPLGKIINLLAGIPPIAARHDVTIATFGHAGDGNMHPTIVYDPHDPDGPTRARDAFTDLLALVSDLGGTISGEHGAGILKRAWLPRELGAAADVQRRIKSALDPHGLLNPGPSLR